MDTAATREFLRAQMANRPESRLQDLCKALYQSTFGCGHLISDVAAAEQSIREELAAGVPSCRDIEPLDGLWDRVPLGILEGVLTPSTLARAFALSAAMPREDTAALEARLDVLRALLAEGALPYNAAEAEAELARWQMAGYPACHHSADYRAVYHPAYRVLHKRYAHLLPLLAAIDRALGSKPRMLLAIEGGSASGKSTLAELLTGIYPDAALFHADDYFLRPEQRTPERFAQPGGNMDRERLEAEILAPLSRGGDVVYRPFDCKTMSLSEPRRSRAARLNIVEGSYSLHPAMEPYYDLSVFLEISPESQRRRVLERNGPEWGQMFFDRWIPLENTYFQATRTAERCTLRLKEETE